MKQLRMLRRSAAPASCSLDEAFEFVVCDESRIDLWLDAAVGLTGERWTRERFVEHMLGDPRVEYDRIYIVVERASGRPAATATAQIDAAHSDCMLHMVSTREEFRGRGLGYAVCARVLEHMHAEGITEVTLKTDDFRLPAIAIYLKLGFLPLLIEDGMETRWDEVMRRLATDTDRYRCIDLSGNEHERVL